MASPIAPPRGSHPRVSAGSGRRGVDRQRLLGADAPGDGRRDLARRRATVRASNSASVVAARAAPSPRPRARTPRPSARRGGRCSKAKVVVVGRDEAVAARRPRSRGCKASCALPSTSARTAEPAYSIAWPCAPSAPMRAMRRQRDVLGRRCRQRARRRPRRACASAASARSSGSSAHARPPTRRCRRRKRRRRHASRCGCRRRRSSGRARSGPARARRHARCPGADHRARNGRCRARRHSAPDGASIRAISGSSIGRARARASAHNGRRSPKVRSGRATRRAALAHLLEREERAFMQEMAVDRRERVAVLAHHDLVGVPQLVDDGPPALAHALPAVWLNCALDAR